MEPEHATSIEDILLCWPEEKIITTPKTVTLLNQSGFALDSNQIDEMKGGDSRCFGKHTITFVYAP